MNFLPRPILCTAVLLAALLSASPLVAQQSSYAAPVTPEIQLGSATQPAIVTVPPAPVVQASAQSSTQTESSVAPASTEVLGSRHFDYIVSPLSQARPGSMADTSISLGDYCRQLRAQKRYAQPPNAMAQPVAPW